MKKVIIVLLLGVIFVFSSFASTTGVNFVTYEVGARSVGMGMSYTGVADSGEAVFYNSGGVAFIEESSIYTSYFSNEFTKQDMFASSIYYPIENLGVMSLNVLYLNYGTSTYTGEYGSQEFGDFSIYETAVGVSYSNELIKNLGFGVNLKYIHSHLADIVGGNASSVALDLGLMYRKNIRLSGDINSKNKIGITIQNIGPDVTYKDAEQSDPLPRYLRMGLSSTLEFDLFNFSQSIMGTYGVDKNTVDTEVKLIHKAGLEYGFEDIIFLRTGYYNDMDNDVSGINWGLTFQYYNISLDFAFDNTSRFGGDDAIKVFSLGYKF